MSSAVEEARDRLQNELGDPPILRLPDGWETSGSWQRAQEHDADVSPDGPAVFSVMLRRDSGEMGSRHRVLFCIHSGELRAECDCNGFDHRQWCAHVALLWWRWSRGRLWVHDTDSQRTYLLPPAWMSVREGSQ